MKKSNLKKLIGLSLVGGVMGVSGYAAAINCPTCCNTNPETYHCYSPPFDGVHPICKFGDPLESFNCANFSGLSFSEQPSKRVRMDWNGIQPNGNPPKNAFVFGFTSTGGINCSKTMSGMVRGTTKTSTMTTCTAAAFSWAYDANQG
jgi:hypothetical protein